MSSEQSARAVDVGELTIANDQPFALFGGVNVLESKQLAIEVAEVFSNSCRSLGIPYVFKASFDKANRSSNSSFRGPGLDAGLEIFSEIKSRFNVPVITDVHEPWQAEPVAQVCDVIQLPAFLSRQIWWLRWREPVRRSISRKRSFSRPRKCSIS